MSRSTVAYAWGGDFPAACLPMRLMTRRQQRAHLRMQRSARWSKAMVLALDATILVLGLALVGTVALSILMVAWPHFGIGNVIAQYGPS